MKDDLGYNDLSTEAKEVIRLEKINDEIKEELLSAELGLIKDEGEFLLEALSKLELYDDLPYHLVDEVEDRIAQLKIRRSTVKNGQTSVYDTEDIAPQSLYLHNVLALPDEHEDTFDKLDKDKLTPLNKKLFTEIEAFRERKESADLPTFDQLFAFTADTELKELIQVLKKDIGLRLSRLDNSDCRQLINKAHTFRVAREGMKEAILAMKRGVYEDKVLELMENTTADIQETLEEYEDNDPSMLGATPRTYEECQSRFIKATSSESFNKWLSWTPGMLAVVLANTNIGKSTFLLNITIDVYRQGGYAPLFLTEMDSELVYDKIWGMMAEVDISHIEYGEMDSKEEEKLIRVICEQHIDADNVLATYLENRDYLIFRENLQSCSLKEHNRIEIFQMGKHFKSIEGMLSLTRRLKKKHGKHMEMLIYDYISPNNVPGSKAAWEKFLEHTCVLETISKTMDILVLSAAQAHDNHKPKYGESLKDSCGWIGGLSIPEDEVGEMEDDVGANDHKYRLQITKTRRRNRFHTKKLGFTLYCERIYFDDTIDLGVQPLPELEKKDGGKPKGKSKRRTSGPKAKELRSLESEGRRAL